MLNATLKDMLVRKRDGRVVPFDRGLIARAMQRAFCAEQECIDPSELSSGVLAKIEQMTDEVVDQSLAEAHSPQGIDVEAIQDRVEFELMRNEFFKVARRYILYREEHARLREQMVAEEPSYEIPAPTLMVNRGGEMETLDLDRLRLQLQHACRDVGPEVATDLAKSVQREVYNGITPDEIADAMVLAARARIEVDPCFDQIAGRLTLNIIYRQALGRTAVNGDLQQLYRTQFSKYVDVGIANGRIDPLMRQFDLDRLAEALDSSRDEQFPYLGLQTIYDRYLLHVEGRRIETPQYFWMRVAMGIALREEESERTQRAIEFYNILSTFRFTSATPTLFNSGTCHPQLSSCYLSTIKDDLDHIFKAISDNARLSKWAGGLGNDWTNIRATNSHIKGTNGRSQGVIPFLKVVSDTAVAVNQGGKRKGAVCSYLESWHLDIDEFLDLRKNTGDDRRRTHDMHTANWIPDLLMKRVMQGGSWTLFSPDEVPDLHDLYGKAFEERYEHYEREAAAGRIRLSRQVPAVDLWRKMLTRLFETGHPWITFKDPSNIRSPQDHCGVVHSSNLCTEILLNTSADETAVCNLGSLNLLAHIEHGELNLERLRETIFTAVRMLDNVIDINFYPTPEAQASNLQHRPIGLGLMGFQDALAASGISYASEQAVEFADRSMEAISYFAILASSKLAEERGTYASYAGSKWDRGLLPIDTIDLLEQERGMPVEMDRSTSMDWQIVRDHVAKHGMRNSNVMAIAPTATISTIIGVTQSIEPTYKHLFAKSNLSGEFTQVNISLVSELKQRNLWNQDILEQLKYNEGTLADIHDLPEDIRARYATSFEIEPKWLIECASRRQKWIDMGQSLNLYISQANGRKLDEMYKLAWRTGLKTTYYLRSLGKTNVEKSTVDINKYGIQPRWMQNRSASSSLQVKRVNTEGVCNMNDPDCEACQ
ncbi:MAG TPA: ribonucleoside-diphosphate reductase subunit alpha [Pirellulaceae bacterium]|nr:ribonucleoside-diphosphate reductase subunit alpha [Pirellulaceae bacterium]HMO93133.1 ribonucleoside-diphosphate reductase subunit alpha [Pirellulaceae bacterium]HMP70308.1 ribonucleoside-diphosphate reductase subunit alpha [Pirellulaceae bacterium]